jgi:redox-sensitive bicupin YhaK (pirin superfamily)
MHGVQLWVNLPARLKMSPPRYQAITGDRLALATTVDGGALVRVIAGDVGGRRGPGVTHTPISYAHATLEPGARVEVPWNPDFNALAYVLGGGGYAGGDRRPVEAHDLVVFGPGDSVIIDAAEHTVREEAFDVLLLGGLPIREPIAHYGPFLMNTRDEIRQAIEDFQSGRMGTIPAVELA